MLVNELDVSRELSHQAIIQTYFTLLPPLGTPPQFSGLRTEWIQQKSNISKVDSSLYIEEMDDYLICLFEYSYGCLTLR